jgi:hypothetical protein
VRPQAQGDGASEDPTDRPGPEDEAPRGRSAQVALADDRAEHEEGCDAENRHGDEGKPGSHPAARPRLPGPLGELVQERAARLGVRRGDRKNGEERRTRDERHRVDGEDPARLSRDDDQAGDGRPGHLNRAP